jgi:hypothetical protein
LSDSHSLRWNRLRGGIFDQSKGVRKDDVAMNGMSVTAEFLGCSSADSYLAWSFRYKFGNGVQIFLNDKIVQVAHLFFNKEASNLLL